MTVPSTGAAVQRLQRIRAHLIGPHSPRVFDASGPLTSPSSHERVSDFQAICAEIDSYETSGNHEKALSAIKEALENLNGRDCLGAALLWRAARAHERLWQASKSGSSRRKGHLDAGLKSAEQALAILNARSSSNSSKFPSAEIGDITTGKTHKWMAVYLGMKASEGGITASARNAPGINMHIRAAIQTLPEDSTLHHMLGRLCFSCAGATWAERAAAKIVGYRVPESTFQESVSHFRRAERLAPTVSNHLWLGKAYMKCATTSKSDTKDTKRYFRLARKWLKRAVSAECRTAEDANAQSEARQTLRSLR